MSNKINYINIKISKELRDELKKKGSSLIPSITCYDKVIRMLLETSSLRETINGKSYKKDKK